MNAYSLRHAANEVELSRIALDVALYAAQKAADEDRNGTDHEAAVRMALSVYRGWLECIRDLARERLAGLGAGEEVTPAAMALPPAPVHGGRAAGWISQEGKQL